MTTISITFNDSPELMGAEKTFPGAFLIILCITAVRSVRLL